MSHDCQPPQAPPPSAVHRHLHPHLLLLSRFADFQWKNQFSIVNKKPCQQLYITNNMQDYNLYAFACS